MNLTAGTDDVRSYARTLRVVAYVVAFLAAGWELLPRDVSVPGAPLAALRVAETLVALVVAVWATRITTLRALYCGIWVLGLNVTVANALLVMLVPTGVWEVVQVMFMVILAGALFAPWGWASQLAFAAVGTAVIFTAVVVGVPGSVLPAAGVLRILMSLLTVSGLSVLGALIKSQDRERVEQSETRFRGLFQAAGDPMVVLQPDGQIDSANRRFEALTGVPLDQLEGQGLGAMLRARGADDAPLALADLLRGIGTAPQTAAATVIRPGSAAEVEATFVRLPGSRGSVIQGIFRDVTERRALERRRVQTQRVEAIARLAGGLAHQFNNLLGGILNQAGLLRQGTDRPDMQAQLDAIGHAARRGERLTKELLRFTPHAAISVQPVTPGAILESVDALARSDDARGPLVVEPANDLPRIAADPDHLVPALMELVFNARDAMRAQADRTVRLMVAEERIAEGDVRWQGAAPGRYVAFSVIDGGAGMDTGTRDRLFEPFFTTKGMHEAEGLGLATVYWVVRAHRGAIAIDSAPGKGTTIRMLLPVAAPAVAAAADAPAPGSRTVLVVDDDPLIRATASRALSRFGYQVVTADDGDLGYEYVTSDGKVDLVILDVVMPGGGPGLMERIRAHRPDLRVLVSSGYGPGGEVRQMLDMGAHGFLQKPYEIGELKTAVEAALN